MSTAPIKTSNPITRVIRAAVFGAIVGVAITRWHNSSHMLDAISDRRIRTRGLGAPKPWC